VKADCILPQAATRVKRQATKKSKKNKIFLHSGHPAGLKGGFYPFSWQSAAPLVLRAFWLRGPLGTHIMAKKSVLVAGFALRVAILRVLWYFCRYGCYARLS
jgi:hypothetical protein